VVQKEIEIINKLGLHARAAAKLVKLASSFDCEIEIQKGNQKVNAKSIMGVMMLAAGRGNVVTIISQGNQASQAIDAIEKLFNDKFGEPE
jgi:phosphocarrier protein